MTRASLLHILDHVSEISDAEIRELEQLAAAFPYCQTAHILLAKTAHDRGSMLASQRLRRAATYAANRDLLRQLLEQPAPASIAVATGTGLGISLGALPAEDGNQPDAELPLVAPEPETIAAVLDQEALSSTSSESDGAAEPAPESTPSSSIDTADTGLAEEAIVSQVERTSSAQDADLATFVASEDNVSDAEVSAVSAPAQQDGSETAVVKPAETIGVEVPETLAFPEAEGATPEEAFPETSEGTEQEEYTEEVSTPAEQTLEVAPPETQDSASPLIQESITSENPETTGLEPALEDTYNTQETALSTETELHDLLPATAPPIRPPAEAGISRFEFDLVEPALPEPSGYLLPDLDEEVAEEPILSGILQRTAPAFHADEDLGYALGAGSRLGYDLQPHDGFTLDLPLDAFFEPDALLLAHIAAHRPKPSTSSLDLINRFLKTKPRIKSPAVDAKPVEEQADLSVRSIQAAPALASESLAKIMVKQGKIDKAIEIYERLMTRQPEKKAYFADQIQQLKQPSA